jgi:hypothetical protein
MITRILFFISAIDNKEEVGCDTVSCAKSRCCNQAEILQGISYVFGKYSKAGYNEFAVKYVKGSSMEVVLSHRIPAILLFDQPLISEATPHSLHFHLRLYEPRPSILLRYSF